VSKIDILATGHLSSVVSIPIPQAICPRLKDTRRYAEGLSHLKDTLRPHSTNNMHISLAHIAEARLFECFVCSVPRFTSRYILCES